MRWSSSNGSRFGSTKARGKRARNSGAPKAGAAANRSSTKLSSERRSASVSSRDAATKAAAAAQAAAAAAGAVVDGLAVGADGDSTYSSGGGGGGDGLMASPDGTNYSPGGTAKYPPCAGVLTVSVAQCAGLLSADRNGLSDPFVRLTLGTAASTSDSSQEGQEPG